METPPSTTKRTSLSNSSKSSSLTPCRRLGLSRPSPAGLKSHIKVKIVTTPEYTKVIQNNVFHQKVESIERTKEAFNTSDISDQNICIQQNDCLKTPTQDQSIVKRVLVDSNITANDSNSFLQLQLSKQRARLKDETKKDQVKKRKLSFQSTSNNGDKEFNKSIISIQCTSLGNLDETSHQTSDVSNSQSREFTDISPEVIQQLIKTIREKKNKLELLKIQETYGKKHKLDELQAQTAQWRVAGQEALRYSLRLARQAGVHVTLQQLMTQHGFPPHLMGYNNEFDEFD